MDSYKKIWEWTGYNELASRLVERDAPGPGEVEVRIQAICICGTDLHIMSGRARFAEQPLPLGYELAGVVERIGEGGRQWKAGDRTVGRSSQIKTQSLIQ